MRIIVTDNGIGLLSVAINPDLVEALRVSVQPDRHDAPRIIEALKLVLLSLESVI